MEENESIDGIYGRVVPNTVILGRSSGVNYQFTMFCV